MYFTDTPELRKFEREMKQKPNFDRRNDYFSNNESSRKRKDIKSDDNKNLITEVRHMKTKSEVLLKFNKITNSIMEVINLNKFDRKRRIAESVKQMYPPGIRIELICMNDPYSPVPSVQGYSSSRR